MKLTNPLPRLKRVKKPTVKSVTEEYRIYKEEAQKHMYTLRNPEGRRLLSVDAADAQGKLNGMTIVELLTIVNLTDATGERVYLRAEVKTITAIAEKKAPTPPWSLL